MGKYMTVDSVSAGDHVVVWKTDAGDWREVPVSVLLEFMRDNLGTPGYTTVFSQPGNTAFTVLCRDTSENQWININPLAAYNDGAITLPALANCIDGQSILVNCSQQVSTFVVNANGALSLVGMPASLASGDHFEARFSALTSSWYAVG